MPLLPKQKDPMGAAIEEYFRTGRAGTLRVFSSQFDEDEIPVEQLFRTLGEMPPLEQQALTLASGNILDVGAGSGCHALALQSNPAFTGSILVACARAVWRLAEEKNFGAKTILDVPPAYLSAKSPAELRKTLL